MLRRLQNPGSGGIAVTGSGYASGRAYAVLTERPGSFPAPERAQWIETALKQLSTRHVGV